MIYTKTLWDSYVCVVIVHHLKVFLTPLDLTRNVCWEPEASTERDKRRGRVYVSAFQVEVLPESVQEIPGRLLKVVTWWSVIQGECRMGMRVGEGVQDDSGVSV